MMLVFGVQNIVQGESKRNNHSGGHFEQNSKWPPNCLVHELTFELFTQEHCVIPLLGGFQGAESIYAFIYRTRGHTDVITTAHIIYPTNGKNKHNRV